MKLDLQSERFAATGGIAAEGARRTLGRPRLDPLDVLMRESVQNALDARESRNTSVEFLIETGEFSASQLDVLREQVFAALGPRNLGLSEVLSRSSVGFICIADRGTVGLAGPTRADKLASAKVPRNFIDFFRNIGRLRDAEVGGGTYGFGKASLYVVSEVGAIVVHTRIRTERGFESRFMAAALGRQYQDETDGGLTNFTGRHWWGKSQDDVVEPLTGRNADALAAQLGFPEFGDRTGTTIAIISPRMPGMASERACRRLAEAVRWYCWPHMLAGRNPSLVLRAKFGGKELSLGAIEDDPLLKSYALAFRGAVKKSGNYAIAQRLQIFDIVCGRPKRDLGTLALLRVYSNVRAPASVDESDSQAAPSGIPCHVAVMRAPKLVVRYMKFSPATDGAAFLGVFVCEEELNSVFAEAEPVTHDEWNADSMEDRNSRTFVRTALRRIEEKVGEYLAPEGGTGNSAGSALPLGRMSRLLGEALPDIGGAGSGSQLLPAARTTSGRGTQRGPTIELDEAPVLLLESGRPAARVGFRIKTPVDGTFKFRCEPRVLTADGGAEREAPIGADVPKVIRWDIPALSAAATGDHIEITGKADVSGFVVVSVPSGCAVAINLRRG